MNPINPVNEALASFLQYNLLDTVDISEFVPIANLSIS